MADLYHLLDEIEEGDELHEPEVAVQEEEEEWESDRENIHVPAALAEAADARKHKVPAADDDDDAAATIGGESDIRSKQQELAGLAYTRLQHLWAQELNAPELLPFDEETVSSLIVACQQQEELSDAYAADNLTGDANLSALFSTVLKIDSERVKFLTADLLKQRLQKIEEHPLHMRTATDKMSENEVQFLKEYGALLEQHLNRTVLDHFPQDVWRKLDAPEMIDEPDLNTYIFVKCKDDVTIDIGTDDDHPDLHAQEAGTCLIVRYNRIRDLLLEGKVELLM